MILLLDRLVGVQDRVDDVVGRGGLAEALKSGPTSPPALLREWQLMQFKSGRRKISSPRAGSPLAVTSATIWLSSPVESGLLSVEMPAARESAATRAGSARPNA